MIKNINKDLPKCLTYLKCVFFKQNMEFKLVEMDFAYVFD